MSQNRIVEIYSEALELTGRMFDAARASDWDGLVKLEQARDRLIEQARVLDAEPPQAGDIQARKRELLQQILERDEEIRALTQDWMRELRDILENANNVQRLQKTYTQR
ncbi:MAG: flagellar protein FliT [Betaproteobacteria bacterium]|nr:flagellar protein FliT [Betaproteobacteria bacterium]